nr:OmpH family outer membrane protein [Pseudoalteromonas sp. MMG010]
MMGTSASALAHKVGIVDMQQVFKQIPQTRQIETSMQTEFAERRQELDKLQGDIRFETEKFQRESTTMSQAQKDELIKKITGMRKNLTDKAAPLEQAMKARQQEEIGKVQTLIIDTITKIAKDDDFDEVKTRDGVIYFNPKEVTDLSDKVIEQVSKK